MDFNVAKMVNHLGTNLYKLLAKENTNVLLSPLGIATALDMLFCGSEKGEAKEMKRVLGNQKTHADIKDEDFKLCFQKLFDALGSDQRHYTLDCCNAVLIDEQFNVESEYKSLLKDTFKAYFREMDFILKSGEAVDLINNWLISKTANRIPKFVDYLNCCATTEMMVFNAAYFKGRWLLPFDEKRTYPQYFCCKGDKEEFTYVDMMHGKGAYRYMEEKSYKVLQLPYKRSPMSFMILLPNSKDGLSALEDSLNSTSIQEMQKRMELVMIEVAIPKFKLEDSIPLKNIFKSLGWAFLFGGRANLKICHDSSKIHKIDMNHTAIVDVNETGDDPLPRLVHSDEDIQQKKKPFIADHPFLFVINDDEKDLILFIGRVNDLEFQKE